MDHSPYLNPQHPTGRALVPGPYHQPGPGHDIIHMHVPFGHVPGMYPMLTPNQNLPFGNNRPPYDWRNPTR